MKINAPPPKLELPPNVKPTGGFVEFTDATTPNALLERHALALENWGVLQVLEGTVCYVDLETNEERHLQPPSKVVIKPQSPHKLRLNGSTHFRIDFFRTE